MRYTHLKVGVYYFFKRDYYRIFGVFADIENDNLFSDEDVLHSEELESFHTDLIEKPDGKVLIENCLGPAKKPVGRNSNGWGSFCIKYSKLIQSNILFR